MNNNVNELKPELLASGSLILYPGRVSSSRAQMAGSSFGQALVINGSQTRRLMTGNEREFGKSTFSIKMPCDAEIVKIIPKFMGGIGKGAIRDNPLDVVIYEDIKTHSLGAIEIPSFSMRHQHYGFKYKSKPLRGKLAKGVFVPKGTILADSPSIDDQGNYRFGLNVETAFMSIPGVIEDGIIISRSLQQKMVAKGFESRTANWGVTKYPLNLYGDENNYKPFPDIGQPIRPDGLLFALRDFDELLGAVEMTPRALMEPDYNYDQLIYAPGLNGKVVDVQVYRDYRHSNASPTPQGMETQANGYHQAQLSFYEQIVSVYEEQNRLRGKRLSITPEFHHLIVEALKLMPNRERNKINKLYKLDPLEEWRVEVTYEYDAVPVEGSKLTDLMGGKGVICGIWEDEDMPTDALGNRADAIMDGHSTVKRMNVARLYEQYINASARELSNQIKTVNPQNKSEVESAWNKLIRFYEIVSPEHYQLLVGPEYNTGYEARLEEIKSIIEDGVYIWAPTDSKVDPYQSMKDLKLEYPACFGPVTYKGRSGNWVTTKDPVLIGALYMIILEKTGVDCSGVASASLNHFGIPSKLNKRSKFSLPRKPTPIRAQGESETRLTASVVGGDLLADILEMSNNPRLHKHVIENIIRADKPTAIDHVIDRNKIPYGGSRATELVKHQLKCMGVEFYYQSTEETIPVIYENEEN